MTYFDELDKIWGRGSPSSSQTRRSRMRPRHTGRWLIAIGVLIAIFVLASISKGIYTDWLWFGSLGYSSIYTTILTTKIWLFFAGAFGFLALLLASLFVARRLSPPSQGSLLTGQGLLFVRRAIDIGILVTAAFTSLVFGLVTSGHWEMVLRLSLIHI